MGQIIKTDAKVVQEEDELRQLKSEISSLEREMGELADDMKFADLYDDEEEKNIIRDERDIIQQQLIDKYNELEKMEG